MMLKLSNLKHALRWHNQLRPDHYGGQDGLSDAEVVALNAAIVAGTVVPGKSATLLRASDGATWRFNGTAFVAGVDGGGVSTLDVVVDTDNQNLAASNSVKIQAALDMPAKFKTVKLKSAGMGSVYIDRALYVGSDTIFDLGGMELKQKPGTSNNQITTKSFKTQPAAVGLSWVAGNTMAVSWVSHGLVVGDYVCIEPTVLSTTAGSAFAGPFPVVDVVDVNTITVTLNYTPETTPNGTWLARKATTNAHVRNGAIDYNVVGGAGGAASGTLNSMSIVWAYTQGTSISTLKMKDVLKYCVIQFNIRDHFVDFVNVNTLSDAVHTFGPAFNVEVCNIAGVCGDDSVAVSSRDVTGNWVDVSGGDILGFTGRNVSVTTDTACCQMYSHTGYKFEGVLYDQITGNAPVALNIFGDRTSGGSINDIEISRLGGTGQVSMQLYGGFLANRLKIGLVRFTHRRHNPINITVGTTWALDQGVDIVSLVEDYSTIDSGFNLSSSPSYINAINGNSTIQNIAINNARFNITGNARLYNIAQNIGLKTISFSGVVMTRKSGSTFLGSLLAINSGVTDNPVINMTNCASDFAYNILTTKSSCRVNTLGCNFQNIPGGAIVLVTDAAASVTLRAFGNAGGMRDFEATAGVVEVYSTDIRTDVGAIGMTKTVSGQVCFNTGVGRGTLAQNRLVSCNGTNWVQLDDPTKIF